MKPYQYRLCMQAKGSSSTDVLHLVGGLDMSFFPSTQTAETEVGHSAGKPTRGVAALVVLSYPVGVIYCTNGLQVQTAEDCCYC